MKRLIEKGLMFGDLIEVASPALIERYNRALKKLTGKETALDRFHIDISGYAPEVGEELGDHAYLNPAGVNRQFILLSTAQKTAPLLNAKFSTSNDILHRFIVENESQLFALTALDAVAGELVNSVFRLSSPRDLFDLRHVTVEADTPAAHLSHARELAELVERFRTEPDAWWDELLIARMAELGQQTGDITRNPMTLERTDFTQPNFWTAHFGGAYVFTQTTQSAVIGVSGADDFGDLPVDRVMGFSNPSKIARWLSENNLAETILSRGSARAGALLRQKMDFMLVDAAASADGARETWTTRSDLRRAARANANAVPHEYTTLARLLRWVEDGGKWPRVASDDPAYFYTLRATQGEHRDLINMMLAELCPLDVRQLFICHKEAFYAAYATWPDAKRAYVVDFLVREYVVDKEGARATLFGPEADMTGKAPARQDERDIVARVGPWGAVRRAR